MSDELEDLLKGLDESGPAPREAVRNMAPYSPPTSGRAGKLRLDFNENTVGTSPMVVAALKKYLTADHLTIYPEYQNAMAGLAKFFHVEHKQFTMTNGTDEAIQVMVNAFVEAGDDVIVLTPSYAMYRFYAEVAGATIREVPYTPGKLTFPLEDLLNALRPETKAVFIANPNNPTGTMVKSEQIRLILETAPEAAVLIDEAYYEFCGTTVLPWINDYKNLFVTRTFSKVYGMAAMRCGCIFSDAGNVHWMRKAQSPYSVNMLAAVAASAAIQDTEYVSRYVTEVLAAREVVSVGFERLGIPYCPSQANFILFDAGDKAAAICEGMRDRGILVRNRTHEIPGAVRVTAGTLEQAERFVAALEELWKR